MARANEPQMTFDDTFCTRSSFSSN